VILYVKPAIQGQQIVLLVMKTLKMRNISLDIFKTKPANVLLVIIPKKQIQNALKMIQI
jgi:hypothetical protein